MSDTEHAIRALIRDVCSDTEGLAQRCLADGVLRVASGLALRHGVDEAIAAAMLRELVVSKAVPPAQRERAQRPTERALPVYDPGRGLT